MKKQQDWIKTISDIKVVRNIQEPYILLKINNRWANISQRQTFTVILNGCVSVATDRSRVQAKDRSYFNRAMPPVEIILFDDLDNEIGRKDVEGITNDSRIVQLWIDTFVQKLNPRIRKNLEKMGYRFNSST